ncbi:MAG: signal recognition particle protein [Gaiellales bacterium]
MLDSLSDRLSDTLGDLRSRGRLSEEDVNAAVREIRLALLEADVNFDVVKSFTATVKERALGADVSDSLTPGQEVVKIVHEELTRLMGEGASKLEMKGQPAVILVCGLQGSGKTTTCGKLARLIAQQGKRPALVACDVYRPAAIQQLVTVGGMADVPVYERGADADPVEIATWGIEQAKQEGRDVVIVDTAGRLTVDTELMGELVRIRDAVRPSDTLLVLDSMTGQDAVNTAQAFQEAIDFDGLILTKLDGDARGGAALSVRAITGVPIKVITTGEKLDQVEEFHPDRLASRILGMGDVLSLIEKAEQLVDKEKAEELERKIRKSEFGLDDMLEQLHSIRKMGSLSSVLGMLPGVGKQLKNANVDDAQLDRVEAIILSMTPQERRDPRIINGSRRARIAAGSGRTVTEVNALIKQHQQMKKMMKSFAGGKGRMPKLPPGMELPPELKG